NNVSVVHQPMMCQHCDHAPCETVCPVLATVHSSDGLNHMAYNRCVGTRYCANNCPYKVRRFNWFNYWNDSRFDNYLNNEFTQLVLNPDVTTRSRGVMEKCSMCIQRIQAGKLTAKLEKRPLKDGDIKMACQQACSANAIIFGDKNDPNSEVSKALRSERTYYVLEEINVEPGIGYMTKIRNIDSETKEVHV
ncbi:MAG: 4Fe-4S dicluster domain-containing protein, partial [Pedobacter sp.]